MSEYERKDEAAIWKNDRREKETHPHYTGDAVIDGVQYYVSAWTKKEGASEKAPVLSLRFTKKDERQGGGSAPAAPASDMDDMPF